MAADNKAKTAPLDGASAGYKRPPPSGQFRPGRSGNPKGRPKGRPNMASLTKKLNNEPVLIRQGNKRRHVPALEAIWRSELAQAARGDTRAASTVFDIYEMTGLTNEISDEERAKRAMHLRKSMSMEEMDLVQNQTCEKDRERCRMRFESDPERFAMSADGEPTITVPASIQAGDRFARDREYDAALAAYLQEISACKVDLTADSSDKGAQARFRRAVARIGLLADTLLLAGDFARAITVADVALNEGATPFWVNKTHPFYDHIVMTGTIWIKAIRAHAFMLNDDVGPARAFYHSFKGDPKIVMTSWETSILRDFVRLRKAGLSHGLMDEIEKRYADEGWTTDIRNTKSSVPKMKPEEVAHLFSHSDQIESGDKLRENGYPHEALTVYLRNLRNWQKNVAKDGTREDWKQNVATAADRVALTIQVLFRRGKFITALENADKAVALAPRNLVLQAARARALLLLGEHDNETRALFMRHRGKIIGDKTWEAFIADQFAELRRMGCERPLMDEIERRFAGLEVSEFSDVDVAPSSKTKDAASALIEASDIPSAEALEEQGLFEQALAVYVRSLNDCNAKIEKFAVGVFNRQAIDDRVTISDKLGNLAVSFLMERNFAKAKEAIDYACSGNQSALLNIWRAHVLMFLGGVDEAKELYLRYRDQNVDGQPGASFILNDFAALRRQELNHPLMDEIEALSTARKISR